MSPLCTVRAMDIDDLAKIGEAELRNQNAANRRVSTVNEAIAAGRRAVAEMKEALKADEYYQNDTPEFIAASIAAVDAVDNNNA